MGVMFRLAVIVLLVACAWYVWVRDPLRPEISQAARFCKSVVSGTPVIGIMKAASEQGATGFASPHADLLVVAFGDSSCALPLRGGAVAGEAFSTPTR